MAVQSEHRSPAVRRGAARDLNCRRLVTSRGQLPTSVRPVAAIRTARPVPTDFHADVTRSRGLRAGQVCVRRGPGAHDSLSGYCLDLQSIILEVVP